MKRFHGIFAATGLMLVMTLVGGCATEGEQAYISADDVRGQTPELATMTRSEGQLKNKEARVINTYRRGFRSDISRVLLLDHNTRLTPHPMP